MSLFRATTTRRLISGLLSVRTYVTIPTLVRAGARDWESRATRYSLSTACLSIFPRATRCSSSSSRPHSEWKVCAVAIVLETVEPVTSERVVLRLEIGARRIGTHPPENEGRIPAYPYTDTGAEGFPPVFGRGEGYIPERRDGSWEVRLPPVRIRILFAHRSFQDYRARAD